MQVSCDSSQTSIAAEFSAAARRAIRQKGSEMKKTMLVAVLALMSGLAMAHSGGTDKYGCHKDHSTGIRHCH